ncbi:chorion protein a at 7F [Musca autumnalis]|uniref:chorion protein a at 7F n=1 Tax=Musca autumnalis TaxID=221902 RepID=UPI003CED69E7
MLLNHNCMVSLSILCCVVLLLPSKLDAGCVCSEKGTDYCSGCEGPRAVRPKQRHYDDPQINVEPIGDSCWCTKKLIEPAVLPKIKAEKKKSCQCTETSSSYSGPTIFSSSYSSSYAGPQTSYVSSSYKDNSPPADPISVSLAVQAGKAIEVPEAKLSYGFVQKPIDGLPKIFMSSVNEENLYALNSEVITLKKKVPLSNAKAVEDEYPEVEDEEPSNAEEEDDEPPRLTYKQLGYVPEEYKNPTFEEVRSSYSSSSTNVESERTVVRGKVSVDCGYKPGRIATYRKSKHGFLRCHDDLH